MSYRGLSLSNIASAAATLLLLAIRVEAQSPPDHNDDHELGAVARVEILPTVARAAGIQDKIASAGVIDVTTRTYGRVVVPAQQISHIRARYPGLLLDVRVRVGDRVDAGDLLARVEANDSLVEYAIEAPIPGVITARHANAGELAGDQALFSIVDTRTLWAELRLFERQRVSVHRGMPVELRSETLRSSAVIESIVPNDDAHPFVIANVAIDNSSGRWAPGTFVEGLVENEVADVAVRVDRRALQRIDGDLVVFVREGDDYEARRVRIGRSDDRYAEVIEGLVAGESYAAEGSFLVKSDAGKSDASHDH